MIFCDTSTAAKLYVSEHESQAVRKRLEAEEAVCVSELLKLEMMGVFHRRLRERKWSQKEFLVAVRQFSNDDLSGFWTWHPLDSSIIEAASKTYTTLPDTVFLRSADCLHLITALHHNFAEIYTHDAHQSTAAGVLGLRAITITS